MKLSTNRLRLRPFIETDINAVQDYAGNINNLIYTEWGPNDEEITKKFVYDAINDWKRDPVLRHDLAIILESSEKLIGGCGIYLNDSRTEGMLGWILHMDYWKQGYMPEVANELIRYGFEDLNLHRIYATCHADNYGSYRVMEKCGMRREAHFIKNRYGRVGEDEQWYDEYHYAILKEEWVR